MVEIQLLGPPTVVVASQVQALVGRQGALLAALALSAGRSVSADRLADVVWGVEPPNEVASALQKRVSRLRGVVDRDRRGDVLVQLGDGYSLNVDDTQVDVRRFERAAAAGRRQLSDGDYPSAETTFTQALDLWHGSALEGFADEPWALGESRRLAELRLGVIEDRLDALLAAGAHDQVAADLVELTQAHPLRERLRAQLMLTYYRLGRQAEALAVYDETRRLLAEELGIDPGPHLQETHRQVLTQDEDLAGPPPQTVEPTRGNLPAPRRRVVGRDHALDQIAQLLGRVRLLTVAGPGGAGKTTVGIEAARRHIVPPDGVWFISLAPVSTIEAVAATLSDTLGLHGGGLGAGTIDDAAVVQALASKDLLLLLDNCEHLLDAVSPLVERLLTSAPRVKVLATSRERLSVDGEAVWSVPGLGLPDDKNVDPEHVAAAPAVQLLVDRVQAHTPDFAIDDSNAVAAATLTRRLDGIPLAVELAASRLRVLSVHEVVSALEDRFLLLAAPSRTAVSRHRTLRAALDWSWDLLTPPLQRSLAALAVPADWFDLRMVSELLHAAQVDQDSLGVVADLVDHSLLTADTAGEHTRYRMLESIRDYGRERLPELGIADTVHAAHADVVHTAAQACQSDLSAECFSVDLDALRVWLDDARVALKWADEHGDRHRLQHLAGALGWLWLLHGLSVEGLRWLDRGLGPPEQVDPDTDDGTALLWASALRAAGTHSSDGRQWAEPAIEAATTAIDAVLARVCAAGHEVNAGNLDAAIATLEMGVNEAEALGGWPLGFVRLIAGQLAWASGRLEQARHDAEDAVALLGAARADWAHAHALETLIDHAIAHGDYGHARTLAEQAVELCRRHWYPELEALMLTKLGLATLELGDHDDAERVLNQAIRQAAAVGSVPALVEANLGAGSSARRGGDLARARAHLHEALTLCEGHAVADVARVHVELVHAAAHAEDGVAAATHADQAFPPARQVGDPRTLARLGEGLAGAIAHSDKPSDAVPLLASAAMVRSTTGVTPVPSEQHDIDRIASCLGSRVDDNTLERTWATAQRRAAGDPLPDLERLIDVHTNSLGH